MSPIFDNIEEIIPENIFKKLDEIHEAMDVIECLTHCIYCGADISYKWIYSRDKWCEFQIYCTNNDCNWIAAKMGFDANCPELL